MCREMRRRNKTWGRGSERLSGGKSIQRWGRREKREFKFGFLDDPYFY